MTDLAHAIQFLQGGITILLGLALGEAFKQLVPDGDQDIRADRVPLLIAFLMLIFPFFHGISRYLYTQYLTHAGDKLGPVSGHVMFDGLIFLTVAALFFVLCRSLSPTHWPRFYTFLLVLLAVDTLWIGVSIWKYKLSLTPWLALNGVLAVVLGLVLNRYRPPRNYSKDDANIGPPAWICAGACVITTIASYFLMSDFYFP